jgi:hypothetical protein
LADTWAMGYDVETQPAEWALGEAARRRRRIVLGLSIWLAVSVVMLVLALQHRVSIVESVLVVALALAVRPYAYRYTDEHLRWLGGGRAEEAVGRTLGELRRDGWIVMHDVTPDTRGNIDHIVSGPNGVFLIETKSRAYLAVHLSKVKRQAARLHDVLGVWVTPVICLNEREGGAFKTKGVSVVPRAVLLEWLRAQREKPVEFERLARFADRL